MGSANAQAECASAQGAAKLVAVGFQHLRELATPSRIGFGSGRSIGFERAELGIDMMPRSCGIELAEETDYDLTVAAEAQELARGLDDGVTTYRT